MCIVRRIDDGGMLMNVQKKKKRTASEKGEVGHSQEEASA